MPFYLTTNEGGDINANVNFNELIVIRVKNAYKCIYQFNNYSGVFDLLWLQKICGAESTQYSEQLFRQKKNALREKNGRDAQALTISVTKGHPEGGGDEFSDWY